MDMMQSPGVQNAINYYNQKNAGKCPGQQTPVTNYDYSFGLKGVTGNQTAFLQARPYSAGKSAIGAVRSGTES
jgi:hypothetical protein